MKNRRRSRTGALEESWEHPDQVNRGSAALHAHDTSWELIPSVDGMHSFWQS